jgi:hypothetical protein
MAGRSLIFGSVKGLSQKVFRRMRRTLEERFDSVAWKDDTLIIHSLRQHGRLKPVFGAIAEGVEEGGGGSLLFVGNGQVVCFYFGPGRFVGRRYREPKPPEWWTETDPEG